jgi:hypothetical protein
LEDYDVHAPDTSTPHGGIRIMISTSLAPIALGIMGALLAPARPAPPQDSPPSEAEVAEATERLELAFQKGGSPERIEAIGAASDVLHADVVEWIDKGLRDKDPEVQAAAIETLRFMDFPAALEALHACYKRDRKLMKHEELSGALLKAIGQHGSKSSIEILGDDAFGSRNHKAIQARILGLGNIRDPESVEELMGLMKKVGRHKAQPYMGEFRLSLMVLTGVDQGKSVDLWIKWWNDAKRDLVVSEKAPKLPQKDQTRWDSYWGNERQYERDQRRRKRGDDGDGGGDGGGGS